jgi:hypothetical protein
MVVVGALVMIRQPANRLGWLFSAVGILWVTSHLALTYADISLRAISPGLLAGKWAAVLGSLASNLAWVMSVTFTFLLFPDGRLPSPRWRFVAWVTAVVIAISLTISIFTPGPLSQLPSIDNPLGLEALAPLMDILNQLFILLFICVSACFVSIFIRYRNAGQSVRQQIKWVGYLGVLMAALYLVTEIVRQLWGDTLALNILDNAGTIAFIAFPVGIGIAILRHRLWDIDVIIRKTLVYAVLTGLLGLVYFGGLTLVGSLLSAISGQQSAIAIVISTLAIAALFNPLRRRVQEFIDRRFYRRKYSAEHALAAFAITARDEVDAEQLIRRLLGVVEETIQPVQVSIWLKASNAKAHRR